jgi:hypothetical protein
MPPAVPQEDTRDGRSVLNILDLVNYDCPKEQ